MENSIYRIKIDCDDDVTLFIYFEGPKDCEEDVLEYYYEKYFTAQPDITKYIITDITSDYNLTREYKPSATLHCAVKAMEYVEQYN